MTFAAIILRTPTASAAISRPVVAESADAAAAAILAELRPDWPDAVVLGLVSTTAPTFAPGAPPAP